MDRILIVEDEKNIVELIKHNLEKNNYIAEYAYDGLEALELFNKKHFDLVLLDLMLPKLDGLELCEKMKNIDETIPIIILTAKGHESDKIKGLNLGADDYITKPFSIKELMARINALLRRVKRIDKKDFLRFKNISIDFLKYEVKKDNEIINLTLKEFELLKLLVENNGKPVSRDTILKEIWGYNFIGETRTVDVHIRNLRSKIEIDDNNPEYIQTVRGIGYRFEM